MTEPRSRLCVVCSGPIRPGSRSRRQTCGRSCGCILREAEKRERAAPREYPAEQVQRVVELYADQRLPVVAVAQALGVSKNFVYRLLADFGIERRKGNPDGRKPLEHPGYDAAHRRIAAKRGRAVTHPCVDCGERADNWSYCGDSPRELIDERTGYPYSPDPADYSPRCYSCHWVYDRGLGGS